MSFLFGCPVCRYLSLVHPDSGRVQYLVNQRLSAGVMQRSIYLKSWNSELGMTSRLSFIGYRCVPAAARCWYATAVSLTWIDTWRHLVDETNICRTNTQRWGTFMSVMDDRDIKVIIQESYVLLAIFADLLYIVIIKMCTQTKTTKEKKSY